MGEAARLARFPPFLGVQPGGLGDCFAFHNRLPSRDLEVVACDSPSLLSRFEITVRSSVIREFTKAL